MKKLKVLKLTDVIWNGCDFYSLQYIILLNGIQISETYYYLSGSNYIIDINNNIDLTDKNVQNSVAKGATIEDMYFVDDKIYSHNICDFDAEGFYDGFYDIDEIGVIFELENDANEYEKFITTNGSLIEWI